MEISITVEELRKRKLFVATPMYGGSCLGMYTKSMIELQKLCTHYGVEMQSFFLFNESLIPRARNYCVDEFLRSEYTHFLFIDADVGFNPNDVFTLMALQSDDSPYDVIGGAYPKKAISWEKIKMAVDKGFADDDPNNLENFVGDYVFNPVNGTDIPLHEPSEVLELGTGFMMIRRSTFAIYDKAYPEQSYKPDHVRSANFDGSREIMAYFDCIIDPVSKRYLSEDYMFCQNIRKAGGKIFLCPWMELKHVGSYIFGGSMSAIASVGASATTDAKTIKKKKK